MKGREEYIYIIIRVKEGKRTDKDDTVLNRILIRYPMIEKIIRKKDKIMTEKPILTRMGKGNGKAIGRYRIAGKGEIIYIGYINKREVLGVIGRMKKEGVFNKESKIEIELYKTNK